MNLANRPMYYKLIDRIAVPIEGRGPEVTMEWARSFEKDRRVAETLVKGFRVSTVFLGLDHSFTLHGAPKLFETMVFKERDKKRGIDVYMDRYATWKQAERGHAYAVKLYSRPRFVRWLMERPDRVRSWVSFTSWLLRLKLRRLSTANKFGKQVRQSKTNDSSSNKIESGNDVEQRNNGQNKSNND